MTVEFEAPLPNSQRFRIQRPARYPSAPQFESKHDEAVFRKERLAAACRVMVNEGFQLCKCVLSVRDAVYPDSFWTIPSCRPLRTICASDLVRVWLTEDGGLADQDSEVQLHAVVFRARPDVNAVIHGHTPNARVYSMQEKELGMLCQDSCIYYKHNAVLPLWSSLKPAMHERFIQDTLGECKALILSNRGILTASPSVESATSYFIRLENCCQAQLLAEMAAKGRGQQPVPIGVDECEFTWEKTGDETHGWALALPYFARVEKQTAGQYKL